MQHHQMQAGLGVREPGGELPSSRPGDGGLAPPLCWAHMPLEPQPAAPTQAGRPRCVVTPLKEEPPLLPRRPKPTAGHHVGSAAAGHQWLATKASAPGGSTDSSKAAARPTLEKLGKGSGSMLLLRPEQEAAGIGGDMV
jgi:hypothetical protein